MVTSYPLLTGVGIRPINWFFGSNPADLFGWCEKDEDLLFRHDVALPGQFAQQWKLRIMAPEAATKEVAKSKLRILLAYHKSFQCTDVGIGDTLLL